MEELNSQLENPSVTEDIPKYIKLCQEQSSASSTLTDFKSNIEMQELLLLTYEDSGLTEEEEAILDNVIGYFEKQNAQILFSDPTDSNDCFVEIHAGSGGTEAQDWVTMLMQMYARFAQKQSLKAEMISFTEGKVAGFKNVVLKVSGHNATGWFKTETGVHRLVRNSPFDANDRRHTSFAAVTAYPEINNDIEVEILDKDLRIDTFRSSGSGGQNVNKVESAVRITHLPTNIVVQSQSERSQHQNKEYCLGMLKAKLYAHKLAEQLQVKQEQLDTLADVSFGHQIRSYVLSPSQQIKDTRTGIESFDADAVLNGDLEKFIIAALADANKEIK